MSMPACRAYAGDATGHIKLSNQGFAFTVQQWDGGKTDMFPKAFELQEDSLQLPNFAQVRIINVH